MNELEKSRIEKAIHNIFKEKGIEIDKIEGNKIYFNDRYYTYSIEEDEDTISLKNRMGITVNKYFISSYQNEFSFTIGK